MSAITGPIAPYSNVPISTAYQPSRFVISAVGLGQQTTVTTTAAHNYVIGQQVRLIIPPSFGCRQLNGVTGYVLSIPSTTQVLLDIDSVGSDAYIASNATTVAQILAIGDINSGILSNTGIVQASTTIPGTFQNIS